MEEASFLYEQRASMLTDSNFLWADIERSENRLEAHINALVIGFDLALETCRKKQESDCGESNATLRVFCRKGRMDLIRELLNSGNFDDEDEQTAVSVALSHELPDSLITECIDFLMEKGGPYALIATGIISHRRVQGREEIVQLLNQNHTETNSAALWALGRIRDLSFHSRALPFIGVEDECLSGSAALYLLRTGYSEGLDKCHEYAPNHDWPLLLIGISAGSSSFPVLSNRVDGDCSEDVIVALGIFGDIRCVEPILEYIETSDLAEAAALALNLITGADIYEEVFIPEPIDEDELFEDEIEKLRKEESLYPPGGEPGETVTRLSQNPSVWREWWENHKSGFRSVVRYRNGHPFSPACLLHNLENERSPRIIRQLAYEEFVIRYNVDFPFETDMFVTMQKQAIEQYRRWVESNQAKFQSGRWYFGGRVI